VDTVTERFDEVIDRLAKLEAALDLLVKRETVKDWYSTEDLAQLLGKAEFTVREWCRLGRVNAQKRQTGRGPHAAWVISHAELIRLQREGLMPRGS
jgi:hypothetical protein